MFLIQALQLKVSPFLYRMQKHFLESMQRVQTDLRLNQSFDLASQKDWILDFMSRIVLVMSEKNNVTTFYLDILFVSVICLSGMDCLLSKKELLITSQDDRIRLFPLAISVLIDRQIWKSASFQVNINLWFSDYTHFNTSQSFLSSGTFYRKKSITFTITAKFFVAK